MGSNNIWTPRTSSGEVADSYEFKRINSLPRRSEWANYVEELTETFKRPEGTERLRPVQAAALAELHECRGLFGAMRVGAGKTLVTYLAPCVMEAKRPLLLIPKKLEGETQEKFRHLSKHWYGPTYYRIESYELVSRSSGSDLLDRYRPDLIVMDESHKLKSTRSALTKRIKRYVEANPETVIVALTGTITKRSIKDYAHLLKWCLRDRSPVPARWDELDLWAAVLDEDPTLLGIDFGAFTQWCENPVPTRYDVREAYKRRLIETPGVIATQSEDVAATLSVHPMVGPTCPRIDAAFQTLHGSWELPDGTMLEDGFRVWAAARELGLGFFYKWDPEPPAEWVVRRKLWASYCRQILKNNRRQLDSAEDVANAIDRGWYEDGGVLSGWREIRGTFEPNSKAVWISDEPLKAIVQWIKDNSPAIIWVQHVEFARELSRRTGLVYYHKQGESDSGRKILHHPPNTSLIASLKSNQEGRNLQAWSRNLVLAPPTTGYEWEQLLGRTHREGQLAQEVTYTYYLGCAAHLDAVLQARRDAVYRQQTTSSDDKLLTSDFVEPILPTIGAQWREKS